MPHRLGEEAMKESYETPKLTRFGSVASLTLDVTGSVVDFTGKNY
jgi:hypothetical protein